MSDFLAIIQLLAIFALVVAATAFKIHMGLAAAIGGILLAFWRGLGFSAVTETLARELASADTLLLLLLMMAIMSFSAAMKKAGAMDRLAAAVGLVAPSPRMAMAITPILIGTLPMPGGAVLSAPLVEAMDADHARTADSLAAANYWFRHVIELVWPLYPAFILTTSLAKIPALRLTALNLYAAPTLFILGLVFVLPDFERKKNGGAARRPKAPAWTRWKAFAAGVFPLVLVLATYVFLDALWRALSPALGLSDSARALIARYAPVMLGLAAGSLFLISRPSGASVFRGSLSASTIKLIAVVLGIRIFSRLIGAAGLAEAASEELARAGIPAIVAIALVPLIAGLVTGVGYGYVGLAFPIVFGLVPQGGAFSREAAIVLAGAFGFAGMMLSPLHVCMVVSAEHFKAGLPATIRRFILPLGIFVVIASAYAALLALVAG